MNGERVLLLVTDGGCKIPQQCLRLLRKMLVQIYLKIHATPCYLVLQSTEEFLVCLDLAELK